MGVHQDRANEDAVRIATGFALVFAYTRRLTRDIPLLPAIHIMMILICFLTTNCSTTEPY